VIAVTLHNQLREGARLIPVPERFIFASIELALSDMGGTKQLCRLGLIEERRKLLYINNDLDGARYSLGLRS